jgi:hypothetical protein
MNWKPDLKFLCGFVRYVSSSIFMMFITAVTA